MPSSLSSLLLLSILLACQGLTVPMRTAVPRMLFGGGGKEGEGGGLNMMETIKKAQQVGVKVKELQEELQQTEIEAVAANGGVTVVISGAQVPISVDVTEELLAQGADAVSEAGAPPTHWHTRLDHRLPHADLSASTRVLVRRSEHRCQGGAHEQHVICAGAHVIALRRDWPARAAAGRQRPNDVNLQGSRALANAEYCDRVANVRPNAQREKAMIGTRIHSNCCHANPIERSCREVSSAFSPHMRGMPHGVRSDTNFYGSPLAGRHCVL